MRLLTWLHIAASIGFLAIVLSVTARSVGGGWSSQGVAWWWIAACAGGTALAFSLLNVIMLGVLIWVAHLVGPVTTSASDAASQCWSVIARARCWPSRRSSSRSAGPPGAATCR